MLITHVVFNIPISVCLIHSFLHSLQPCLINIFRPGQSIELTPHPHPTACFVWLLGLARVASIRASSDSSLQHETEPNTQIY